MPLRPCLTCGALTTARRCPRCQPTTTRRGYGWFHQSRTAKLRKQAEDAEAPCILCGHPIDYTLRAPHPLSFVAHHLTRDKRGPIAPSHKRCNEVAGQPRH